MSNTLKLGNGKWATGKDTLLSFSDTNNNYKPLAFSFSRASSGTVINKDGLIETVGTGEPRIDFKDNTKGSLLLEPQRVNIFDYSSDLSAWSKLNSTVTESSVLSLDGVNNSYAYEKTSSSTSYIYRTVSLSNTTDYTLSFFVKSGTSTNVRTDIWDTIQSVQCQIQIDLVTKTVSNFVGNSYKIEDYKNGWMRVSVSFTSESSFGTTFNRYFNIDSVGSELYIWGAQVEQGSYATSYIPTSGSAVTRVADVCNNGGNEQVINSTEGVLYAEFEISDLSTSLAYPIAIYGTGSAIQIYYRPVSQSITFLSIVGGVQYIYHSNINPLGVHKVALSYKNNQYTSFADGVLLNRQNSGNVPTPNTLNTLSLKDSGVSNFNGKIKEVKLYNTVLTDQELITLTTI